MSHSKSASFYRSRYTLALWSFANVVVACPWAILLYIAKLVQTHPVSAGLSEEIELNVRRGITVQNAQDDWSSLVAGIAPLVLLVGERVTKQHLRESTSRWDYFQLGATPFGLVTSVVSLLRLVSLSIVTRLIGRSDELLQDVCKEITPVNTGNVTSILEEGIVQRGAVETEKGATGVFTNLVRRLHVWEFNTSVDELMREARKCVESLRRMNEAYKYSADPAVPTHLALIVADFEDERHDDSIIEDVQKIYDLNDVSVGEKDSMIRGIMSTKITAVGGEVNFVKGEVRSPRTKKALVIMSVSLIFALFVTSLADANWNVSLPWLFVVAGYVGLLAAVGMYAEAIKHRIATTSVELGPHLSGSTSCALQNGNIDKDGTVGYALDISNLGGIDVVNVSCLRNPSFAAQVSGTLAGVAFLASFLVHYLGLRSVQWWVSLCELAICFAMVGIRTLSSRTPIPFVLSDCVYDTDLRSIGVIRSAERKTAKVIEETLPYDLFRSVRMHFGIRKMGDKTQGDAAAALVATTLSEMDSEKRQAIYAKLGLARCQVQKIRLNDSAYVIIHCGGTALVTKEGYLRPARPLLWAQEFSLSQLANESLIGWCINGMSRNAELQQLSEFKVSSQSVYIPATNSLVDWWLRSEGSNNWEYNGDNLQWSGALPLGVLLCKLAMDTICDQEFKAELHRLFRSANANATITARAVAKDFLEALETFPG